MSALRIAAVTHVLKNLLNDGLINDDFATILNSDLKVTSLCPGQIDAGGDVTTQLNIFLYRVTPNTGWNNLAYPSRNAAGERIKNPPLALDLHYLLTAFGANELDTEILLGYGMQLLHENPGLGRDLINTSLSTAAVNNTLPLSLRQVAGSGLADQIEQITITPDPINTEEMSRLWTAFQTRYRPCAAYKVTVVLLERERPTRPALPVQRRQVFAIPFQQPRIEKILSQAENIDTNPLVEFRRITLGDRILIKGQNLRSDGVELRINNTAISLDPNAVGTKISPTEISFVLAEPAGENLKAGVQGIQVVQPLSLEQPPVLEENNGNLNTTPVPSIQRGEKTSNLQAFVLNPSLSGVPSNGPMLEATVSPVIQEGQRAVVLLNQINTTNSSPPPNSYSFNVSTAGGTTISNISLDLSGIAHGEYLVRVQVDGAESPLTTDADGKFTGPSITIP